MSLILVNKSEVGKAQLKAQSATYAIAKVALRTKVFKICCALTLIRTVFLGNLIGTYVDNCQHAVFQGTLPTQGII